MTLAGSKASIDGNDVKVERGGRKIDESVVIGLIEATKQLDDVGGDGGEATDDDSR